METLNTSFSPDYCSKSLAQSMPKPMNRENFLSYGLDVQKEFIIPQITQFLEELSRQGLLFLGNAGQGTTGRAYYVVSRSKGEIFVVKVPMKGSVQEEEILSQLETFEDLNVLSVRKRGLFTLLESGVTNLNLFTGFLANNKIVWPPDALRGMIYQLNAQVQAFDQKGIYQNDPHSGNIILIPDHAKIIDFSHGELTSKSSEKLTMDIKRLCDTINSVITRQKCMLEVDIKDNKAALEDLKQLEKELCSNDFGQAAESWKDHLEHFQQFLQTTLPLYEIYDLENHKEKVFPLALKFKEFELVDKLSDHLDKALKINCEEPASLAQRAFYHGMQGFTSIRKGTFLKAIKHFEEAISYYKDHEEEIGLAYCYYGLGMAKSRQPRIDPVEKELDPVEDFEKSFDIWKTENHHRNALLVLVGLRKHFETQQMGTQVRKYDRKINDYLVELEQPLRDELCQFLGRDIQAMAIDAYPDTMIDNKSSFKQSGESSLEERKIPYTESKPLRKVNVSSQLDEDSVDFWDLNATPNDNDEEYTYNDQSAIKSAEKGCWKQFKETETQYCFERSGPPLEVKFPGGYHQKYADMCVSNTFFRSLS